MCFFRLPSPKSLEKPLYTGFPEIEDALNPHHTLHSPSPYPHQSQATQDSVITGRPKRNAVLAYEKCRFATCEMAFLCLLCCFWLLNMLFTMPKYEIYRC